MKQKTLKNAPIVESVIEIKFDNSTTDDINSLKEIHEKIRTDFPLIDEKYSFRSSFHIDNTGIKQESEKEIKRLEAITFFNNEKDRIIEVNLNKFSFRQNTKYTNWNDFKGNAKKFWDIAESVINPTSINRLGLRYINKIEFDNSFELTDYFNIGTIKNVENDVINFYHSIVLLNDKKDSRANISIVKQEGNSNSDAIDIFVDIDVYKQKPNLKGNVWDEYDLLRDFKNELFFKIVTNKTINKLEEQGD